MTLFKLKHYLIRVLMVLVTVAICAGLIWVSISVMVEMHNYVHDLTRRITND